MLIPGDISETSAPRLWRRAEPRFLILLAAAGALIAATGPLLIGGDTVDLADMGQSNLPGAALSLVVVAAGYALLARIGAGPLATAGSIAVVFCVPAVVFFVTLEPGATPSVEPILSVTALVFGGTWLLGPARGRPVFLGGALVATWLFVLQVIDGTITVVPDVVDVTVVPVPPGVPGPSSTGPQPLTSGLISLAFGIAYLVLARRWDLRGAHGAATPPAAVGLLAVAAGVVWLAEDFEPASTGFLLMMIGVAVAAHGANTGRRATTWLGGFGLAAGLALIVTDAFDSARTAGVSLVVVGAAVVVAAHQLRVPVGEGDEVARAADRLRSRARPQLLTTLGAAGGVLVAVGATTVGIDALLRGDGTGAKIPGTIAAAGLVVVGYLLVWRTGSGPRASAGSVAALAGVPAFVVFATFDAHAHTVVSVIGLLAVSAVAWTGTWLWSKRPAFLGAATFAVWFLLLELVENAISFVVSGDFIDVVFVFFGEVPDVDIPDPTILGVLSLAVGLGCLAAAVWLDRRGDVGVATPLVAPLVISLQVGLTFLAEDLEQSGSGVTMAALGCIVALAGCRAGRRAMAWSGLVGMVSGVALVIGDVVTTATSAGLVATIVGATIVLAAHGLSTQLDEPDEMTPKTPVPAHRPDEEPSREL